jgi:GNAT superfamily N-acetyltransferase
VAGNVLHRAGPEDLEDLVWLAREFCHAEQHDFDLDRVITALSPLLADDSLGQVWLVENPEHPGERAGYAVLTWSWSLACGGLQCLIDELYVRAHGNSLATRVLAELLEVARAEGAARVVVETEAHDRRVREFYGKADFDLTDSVWMSTLVRGFPPTKN